MEYKVLILTSSSLLLTLNAIGAHASQIPLVESTKRIIRDIISQSHKSEPQILFECFLESSIKCHCYSLKAPEDVLDGIVDQIGKFLVKESQASEERVKGIQNQLLQLKDEQNAVKNLLGTFV